jgi:hypothetical protein
VRGPGLDETPLSMSEVVFGLRCGLIDQADQSFTA